MNKHREWSEIGKMYEELEECCDTIEASYDVKDEPVHLFVDNTEEVGDYVGETLYDVVKQAYFDFVLDAGATVTFPLEISNDLMNDLFDMADTEGKPVDELINEMLSAAVCAEDDCDCEEDNCEDCGGDEEMDERESIMREIAEMEKEYTNQFSIEQLKAFRDMFKAMYM